MNKYLVAAFGAVTGAAIISAANYNRHENAYKAVEQLCRMQFSTYANRLTIHHDLTPDVDLAHANSVCIMTLKIDNGVKTTFEYPVIPTLPSSEVQPYEVQPYEVQP